MRQAHAHAPRNAMDALAAPVVLKFGGTSVEDASALERVSDIIRASVPARPVVVVSALAGITDALLALAVAGAQDSSGAMAALEPLLARHGEVARQLLSPVDATPVLRELDSARASVSELIARIVRDPDDLAALKDEVVAYGEHLSATLLTAVLAGRGAAARYVDARRCIVTDDAHPGAVPLLSETRERSRIELLPLLARDEIPVLGGFVAAGRTGATTTLGRGGSDYSAALIGASLNAAEVQIWTDVSGVMTADPRTVRGARPIPRLSYAEAAELAYFGAKVLHPRTIQPAMREGIPVRICNSRAPEDPGTLVTATTDVWPDAVKAVAHKSGISIVHVVSARMLGSHGFLRALFEVFDRHRISVDVVATSEVSVSLSVEEEDSALPQLVEDLRELGDVQLEPHRAIVCVVGEGLRRTPGVAARVFETLGSINVVLISQGASQVNLTFVVDEEVVGDAVARLHAGLLERTEPPVAATPEASVWASKALDVFALTRHLIDIPSVSGDEGVIARSLAGLLNERGYRVSLIDAAPGRPNLLATTGAPPRVVLCTHLDTVPPFIGSSDEGDSIAGRGACDAKGILAAQITAAEILRAAGVREIGLLFVVDEELASLGARAANAHAEASEGRYVVVGEPTDNKLAVGCSGSLRVALRTHGTGGHSAYADPRASAIDRLLEVLTDVRACTWPRDALFGDTSVNIGVVTGGTRTNVVAAEARADLHIRLATDAEPVRRLLQRAVAGRAAIEYLSVTPPVQLLGVPGFEQCVVGFTSDAAHLAHWGVPLLLGPGSITDAHTAHERIVKADLKRGVDLYVRLVRALLDQVAVDEGRVAAWERAAGAIP